MSSGQASTPQEPLADDSQSKQNAYWPDAVYKLHNTPCADEITWGNRYDFLLSKGYRMRPRLRPGWVPSWITEPISDPSYREDWALSHISSKIMDATRVSDGKIIVIKRTQTRGNESQIALLLCNAASQANDKSHCVPIFDVFEDESDPEVTYIVMPLLRHIDDPECSTVENVADLVDQTLKGLAFMHSQGVAHRDCAAPNIMMDGDALFPEGFSPVLPLRVPDCSRFAKQKSRAGTPVTYYFIDYDLSVYIPLDVRPKLAVGRWGRDRDVPELSPDIPYDPFKVDIFIIGNLLRKEFYDKYSNVGFLKPLIDAMTQLDPKSRPDAPWVLAQWTKIRRGLYLIQRQRRLIVRDSSWAAYAMWDTISLVESGYRLSQKLLGS